MAKVFTPSVEELVKIGARKFGFTQTRNGFNIDSALRLLDSGCSVPFVARYRAAETGGMGPESLESLFRSMERYRNLVAKKNVAANSASRAIEESDKLKNVLEELSAAESVDDIDRIHSQFKAKRSSKVERAMELGLGPFADVLWQPLAYSNSKTQSAKIFDRREFKSLVEKYAPNLLMKEVLAGTTDILSHKLAHEVEVKTEMRKRFWNSALLKVTLSRSFKIDDKESKSHKYERYVDFCQPVWKVSPTAVLAIERGVNAKILSIKFELESAQDQVKYLIGWKRLDRAQNIDPEFIEMLSNVLKGGWALMKDSIVRSVRRELNTMAQEQSLLVFTRNLRQLLTLPPYPRRCTILGIDPGFKHGCKLTVVDEDGQYKDHSVVYVDPHRKSSSRKELQRLVSLHGVELVAIGNGTASREAEILVSESNLITEAGNRVRYVVVNESGVSIYSASSNAREEFGEDLDPLVIGGISIARRLQNPLHELVKYDPSTLGVGMYQKDMNQKDLGKALDSVVQSCVSLCGVDVNRASVTLLSKLAGLSGTVAKSIKKYQEQNGPFKSLQSLTKVRGFGVSTLQECSGFLRVDDGDEPLDNSILLPDMYADARRLFDSCGVSDIKDVLRDHNKLRSVLSSAKINIQDEAMHTVYDLLMGEWDPRESRPALSLRSGPLSMKDLKIGDILKGWVLNTTDFGVFVDIGVEKSALIHVSQLPDRNSLPLIGEPLRVEVTHIDTDKGYINLRIHSDDKKEMTTKQALHSKPYLDGKEERKSFKRQRL